MAQLVVRNLDESVKRRLKRRAAQRGHSLEQEVREILQNAVDGERARHEGLGTRIARRFAGKDLDFDVPEWPGEEARPAKFPK